jgi:hypothetical protein
MIAKDNVAQKVKGFKIFDVKVNAATFPIKQGSLVVWDAVAGIAKEAAAAAIGDKLLGCSENTVPVASNIDNGVTPIQYSINACYGDVFSMGATTGESYVDFDPVYVGADAQTITKVNAGSQVAIGYVKLPSGTASIAGSAGVKVPVYLFSNFPVVSV